MKPDNAPIDSKASQVSGGDNKKQAISIGIALVVVVFIVIMAFKGHGHQNKSSQRESAGLISDHDEIIQRNADHLKALQAMNKHRGMRSLLSNTQHESKEIKLRRNAPTQIYASDQTIQLGKTKETKDSVLSSKNDPYADFANNQASESNTVTSSTIAHPENTIAQGELVHAVLETAVNSDLPGMVRAVITQPVYSYVGSSVLLPKGSRLIGQYASLAGNGSATQRIYVMWNRVITPKGVSVMINSPSSSPLGTSGQAASRIDTHFWHIFGRASLVSILGAGAANISASDNEQSNAGEAYRQAISDSFQQTASKMLKKDLNIAPTLHIDQGALINVFVARDVVFDMGLR